MNKTNIEWVKNPDGSQGCTWNPITGCLNNDNGLCKSGGFPCYAYKLANGRLKERYLANTNIAPGAKGGTMKVMVRGQIKHMEREGDYADSFYPRFWENRLKELEPWHKLKYFTEDGLSKVQIKGIFVCDMGDLFGIGVPEAWTRQVLAECKIHFNHRFYPLTKQPQNLVKFSPFPENCWVGVTATNDMYMRIAINELRRVQAKVKYLSLEPLLSWISPELDSLQLWLSHIDWLIIGACTGTHKEMSQLCSRTDIPYINVKPFGKKWTLQPKIEWIREIVEAADKAGIPVFLKDNLRPLIGKLKLIEAGNLVDDNWQLRQEIPE